MTGAADPAQDPLAFQVLNEIGIIGQLSGNRAERLLAPDLNLSQFVVLNHFYRLGGERSLVRLAGAMQVTKGAMTNTVTRLHAKGWLAVRPDPHDGRGKLVALTEAGSEVRMRAVARLATTFKDLDAAIGAEQLGDMLAGLRRLRTWLDANRA